MDKDAKKQYNKAYRLKNQCKYDKEYMQLYF